MRRAVLAAFAAAIVGCTNGGHAPGDQPNGPSSIEDASGDPSISSDWSTEASRSGIDGETRTASRVYQFPERQTQFQVVASCIVGTGISELTVDSFIGDSQRPSEGSAFVAQGQDQRFMAPVGRAKASDSKVTELRSYFSLGSDYNNRIKFDFNNPVARTIIPEDPAYNALASTFEEGDVNYAKLLLAALPVTIQVKNGAGDFELEIDRSEELIATLKACGAGGPLLSASYTERAKLAEQDASDEVVKNVKSICGYRGVVHTTSEPWQETAKKLSISLDCAESAPQELAAFNSKIDAYLKTALAKGITCSREALVRQAAEAGVDDGILWTSYLRNYCSP